MPVSFDLFGTLVSVREVPEPASAVRDALRDRGVAVPDDWEAAYCERHVSVAEGAELSLVTHVDAALESREVAASERTVEQAVRAAFSRAVDTRPGAVEAVTAVRDRTVVGICSNCAVPGLVEGAIEDSKLQLEWFDGVVSSVDVGWRKPDPRIFEAVATELGCRVVDLVHVGDDPHADGGIETAGGRAVLLEERDLSRIPQLEGV